MKRLRPAMAVLLVLLALPAGSQRRFPRDPLTPAETDEIREAADQPDQKLKLFIKFTRARMEAIDQLRAAPKPPADRGARIHDLLEDVSELVDEIDRNLGSFAHRKEDIRKALHLIEVMNSEFQFKLHALHQEADDPNNKEAAEFKYAVDDAQDSVRACVEDARDVLAEQEEAAAAAKAAQKEKKK